MSNLMKLAIPLLNDELTKEDFDKESGFVDAFFEDINKPACCNHIFLMYDLHSGGKNVAACNDKMFNLKNRYGYRTAYIDKKPYAIISCTANKTIRELREGSIMLSLNQKKKILDFWGSTEPWVTNNLLAGVMFSKPTKSSVPEEDYHPEAF